MKKNCLLFLALFFLQIPLLFSQPKKTKLVVGIVVDQMRNDFISRYWDRFGEGGFKRLVNNGFYFKNTHYNYIPTYTGPGHCTIYTGTTPRYHGIIGNDWFVKKNFSYTYCTQDTSVRTVGSDSKNGMASPKNQLSPTIGDELKINFNQRSKVFAVALKDRSAILPAGHAADAAFWFDDASGGFISSSWYVKQLPAWLTSFNEKKAAATYLQKGWSTLYPLETYINSITDDNRYEAAPFKEKAVFPYEFKSYLEKNTLGIIKATPYGNSITKDLAIECLKNEQLGKDAVPDLFCISFSSTDIVAHSFGPRSVEVEDVYLRLDKDIEELLNTLDKEVGKNNYVVFLTADHGAADVPNHLLDNKIPAGYVKEKKIEKQIKEFFKTNYGDTLLLANLSNEQVFLNEPLLYNMKLSKEEVEDRLCKFLPNLKGIAEAYSSQTMRNGSFDHSDIRALLQNGYNHQLSGNVCYTYLPGWMEYTEKGTTHGTGYNYDTHVPLLFYGNGIKTGSSYNYVSITQIAPTVCELIEINQPGTSFSEPLNNYFK
jgi:predicted AlkP superfamily pyrophosphatase or phosphodiesterase